MDDSGNLMMQMGLSYGQKVFQEGEKGLARYLPFVSDLRRYFRVDNAYVKAKLAVLLVPFNKPFTRQQYQFGYDDGGAGGGASDNGTALPPTSDVYAYDLYIPLMAAITYVTLCGFVCGLQQASLKPEYLLAVLTTLVFMVGLEVALVKLARYILAIPAHLPALDLVALSAYKYAGICLLLVVREITQLDGLLYSLQILYVAAAYSFFVYKMLGEALSRDKKIPKVAQPLVYGAAAVQLPLVLWFATRPFVAMK
jgi:hypothetical protein